MRGPDAVRLAAALGAIEMALVRRDLVVGPLLAQAARAASETQIAPLLVCAAEQTRADDFFADTSPAIARRKMTQALCRAAAHEVHAELLVMTGIDMGAS